MAAIFWHLAANVCYRPNCPVVILGVISYHQFLCINADFEELCDGIHKTLVVEIAHLLNLAIMVPYPGIQLFHEALVGIGLVIVYRPERHKQGEKIEGLKEQKKKGDKAGRERWLNRENYLVHWPLMIVSQYSF